MNGSRSAKSLIAVTIGVIALAGCSHSSRGVNDARCVEFRKQASVYTDKVTKTRHARRLIEDAIAGKTATPEQKAALRDATNLWLTAKHDLEKFYASDTSGCVSK